MIYTAFYFLLTVKLPLTKVYLNLNLLLINAASYKVSPEFVSGQNISLLVYCMSRGKRDMSYRPNTL